MLVPTAMHGYENLVLEVCGVKKSFGGHMDKSLLRWYGHIKHIVDKSLVKMIYG